MSRDLSTSIDRIAEWIDSSPRMLIGAGAGLSVAAGLDYTDRESFARHYPGLARRGFHACYELIGRHDLPESVFWGYWAVHVKLARFTPHVAPVYVALRRLTAGKDTFVMTSNVEGLFAQHEFESDRIWTRQGDFAHMHCTARCSELVWPSEPIIDRMLQHMDPTTQEVDPDAVPRCPTCAGSVFFNVREDSTFVETPYLDQSKRCVASIESAMGGPLLILEIGAGFNTPGVVRYPLERLAAQHPTRVSYASTENIRLFIVPRWIVPLESAATRARSSRGSGTPSPLDRRRPPLGRKGVPNVARLERCLGCTGHARGNVSPSN